MSTSPSPSSTDIETLRATWTQLYRSTLPSLAKSRNPAQPTWPVTLDHCFARIILDNTIGKAAGPNGENTQWDKVIGKPAVRNMSERQLRGAIELGERIAKGDVDLVELDGWSLRVRGKTKGGGKRKSEGVKEEEERGNKKRKVEVDDVEGSKDEVKEKATIKLGSQGKKKQSEGKKQTQSTLSFQSSSSPSTSASSTDSSSKKNPSLSKTRTPDISNDTHLSRETIQKTLHKIQTHPGLTPFRKRLYTSLLSVPTGEHTTYAALAKHLGSVARAVGNGMRNNPFAPTVPCHRVLASDGTLGGFFGDWGVEGKYGNEKIGLLKGEGVNFSSSGKVKGMVWSGFWDLGEFEKEFGKVV